MIKFIYVLIILSFSLAAQIAEANIINVPKHYPTIQQAIVAASEGDTVLVWPGIYVEIIDFLGKSITVKSLEGPNSTVIDGDHSWSVVTFKNGEGLNSVLEGFTIRNGIGSLNTAYFLGGGVYCYNGSSPAINGNIINDNTADYGGGIYCGSNSEPIVTGNTLLNNIADYGGGMCNENSSPTITNCSFSENSATADGGGMFNVGSSYPTVTNCMFSNNSANSGGGMYNEYDSFPTVTNCTFIRNSAGWQGGGIASEGYIGTISNNLIAENICTRGGGGIYCHYSGGTIKDNEIIGNMARDGGGIFSSGDHNPIVQDNKIVGNTANRFGGGLYYQGQERIAAATISDNDILNNTADKGGGIYLSGSLSPYIIEGLIKDNFALELGGGIYCEAHWYYSYYPYFRDVTIERNTANYGGGIYVQENNGNEGGLLISGAIITHNTANYEGGGIYIGEAESMVRNFLISGTIITHNAANYGGGIYVWGPVPPLVSGRSDREMIAASTTITKNMAYLGGGIFCDNSSSPTVMNSIMWDDSSEVGPEIYLNDGSSINISYSDIQGGWKGIGIVDSDPMFVLPENFDYRLLWESPCIDTGHPDSLDADYTRRDMGAYFFNQDDYLTLYLTPDTTEVASGNPLGVTYTLINRWGQPEQFWGETQVAPPTGSPRNILGPALFSIPSSKTIQRHFNHNVPLGAPLGQYDYWTQIESPPETLYDEDRFTFRVRE